MTKFPPVSVLASATTRPRSTNATVALGVPRPASRASPLGSTRTMSKDGGVAFGACSAFVDAVAGEVARVTEGFTTVGGGGSPRARPCPGTAASISTCDRHRRSQSLPAEAADEGEQQNHDGKNGNPSLGADTALLLLFGRRSYFHIGRGIQAAIWTRQRGDADEVQPPAPFDARSRNSVTAGAGRLENVCVYCGSASGGDPAFEAAARTLGHALGR